jgi:hypothetical protein
VSTLLVLTGCADSGRNQMDEREQQNAQLRERPTSESEVARLTEAQEAIRVRLEAVPLGPWTPSLSEGTAGCGDLGMSDGRTVFLPGLFLEDGVPDEVWPRAVDAVRAAAGEYGFGSPEVVVDDPGEHEVVLRGERGALLRFGTLQSATLQLETGCHLPAKIHAASSGGACRDSARTGLGS